MIAELLDELFGDRTLLGHLGALICKYERLGLNQVHDPPEGVLFADRELDGDGIGLEPVADAVYDAQEVSPDPVHLVDEADSRDAIAVRLAPHGLGLGLDAGHGVEHDHAAVEDAEASLHPRP